jgi:hypothetical protein
LAPREKTKRRQKGEKGKKERQASKRSLSLHLSFSISLFLSFSLSFLDQNPLGVAVSAHLFHPISFLLLLGLDDEAFGYLKHLLQNTHANRGCSQQGFVL